MHIDFNTANRILIIPAYPSLFILRSFVYCKKQLIDLADVKEMFRFRSDKLNVASNYILAAKRNLNVTLKLAPMVN